MASYNEDITLLAFAQVLATVPIEESVLLFASAQVTLTDSTAPSESINLLASASVSLEDSLTYEDIVTLLAEALIFVEDEFLGDLSVVLLAEAQVSVEDELGNEESAIVLLCEAQITLEDELIGDRPAPATGGVFGSAPPVRIRQDTLPVLTPTPTRRVKLPSQG